MEEISSIPLLFEQRYSREQFPNTMDIYQPFLSYAHALVQLA